MAPSDAVEKARALLEARREELHEELEQIDNALAGLGGRRRGPGRPRGSTAASSPAPRNNGGGRRRRRRGGTRAEHALSHVSTNPGATASEIATAMGIKPNYVYRVMAELEKDGRVRKQGKGYFATGETTEVSAAGDEPQAHPAAPADAGAATGADTSSDESGEEPAPPDADEPARAEDEPPAGTSATEQPAPVWERTSPLR